MQMGLVGIKLDDMFPEKEIRNNSQLYQQNNSNKWWLYTKPNSSVTFDFKNEIAINRIQIHSSKPGINYPWKQSKPSYALEFSHDNETYDTLFAENKSERISETITDAYYLFNPEIKYRYARLRITNTSYNSFGHGMYISWFEFYTSSIKEITCKIKYHWLLNTVPLYIFILLDSE